MKRFYPERDGGTFYPGPYISWNPPTFYVVDSTHELDRIDCRSWKHAKETAERLNTQHEAGLPLRGPLRKERNMPTQHTLDEIFAWLDQHGEQVIDTPGNPAFDVCNLCYETPNPDALVAAAKHMLTRAFAELG